MALWSSNQHCPQRSGTDLILKKETSGPYPQATGWGNGGSSVSISAGSLPPSSTSSGVRRHILQSYPPTACLNIGTCLPSVSASLANLAPASWMFLPSNHSLFRKYALHYLYAPICPASSCPWLSIILKAKPRVHRFYAGSALPAHPSSISKPGSKAPRGDFSS